MNAFLGAHRYASRLASNSVVEYALWLQDLSPEKHERLIRWWQDEIEGTGRVRFSQVDSQAGSICGLAEARMRICVCSGRNFCCGLSRMRSICLRRCWESSGM